MRKFILYIIVLSHLFSPDLSAQQNNAGLKFNKDGKFKVAQFTDIHWHHNSPNCSLTTATIKHVLNVEKPDIAVLTGDIVVATPAKEGWQAIARIFEEVAMPFAVVMGNHDAEPDITREEIFDILEQYTCFIGEKGTQEIYGCGNYVVPVWGNNNKTSALLYCIDSNDYPAGSKHGTYDWIHYDQIAWYREQSRSFTGNNNGVPLPSLAFFHIPLLEFDNVAGKSSSTGHKEEDNCPPLINTGMFASMAEMKDVMGVFVGHDHNNDYIGMEFDISLGFGRVTGADAYGKLERGARIIEMHENKFKFDTWIRTSDGTEFMYYYPSGLSSLDEENLLFHQAKKVNPAQQGVSYKYYRGKFRSTDEITNATMLKQGTFKNFIIDEADDKDEFAYEFRAYIHIPEKGVYRFYTFSDDGSTLFIDGHLVAANDGSHGARRADGKIGLEAGYHEIRLLYFEDYMGQVLEVGYSSKDILETIIPSGILYVAD